MKKVLAGLMLLSAVIAAPVYARTNTYFGFQIGISNAPPAPQVRYWREPSMIVVPDSRVYVVRDDPGYDMFRFNGFYYVQENGYWYRARNYRGPFQVIDVRWVPRPIFNVPSSNWRHRNWDRGYMTERRGRGHDRNDRNDQYDRHHNRRD